MPPSSNQPDPEGPPASASSAPVPAGVRTTKRRGRSSEAKRRVLLTSGPRWLVPPAGPWTIEALAGHFGRVRPLFIDIGVGNGTATRAWAADHPDRSVLAIELHRPGIATLLTDLDRDGPDNVRIAEVDALEALAALPDRSVAGLRVLFPDPWPKRRHVARRMVDRAFVQLAARVLEVGGELHLATDWADYADHMRTMVATEPRFEPLAAAGRPDRPVTTYEQRGLDAGRTIVDLRYRLLAAAPG